MSAPTTPSISTRPGTASRKGSAAARAFYSASAAVVLALTVWGFHHFYLQGRSYPGREITPPIRTLIIAHAVAMSAWLVLFMVQTLLIATKRPRVHMTLGRLGVVLAVVVVGLGLAVAVESARVSPPESVIWGLGPREFMAVPFLGIIMFAGFVGVGVWRRRRAGVHRPMMLVGTLSAAAAGISRIDALSNLYVGTSLERHMGPFLVTCVLAVVLLAVRSVLVRSLDRAFAIGVAALIAGSALIMYTARTSAWERFVALLLGATG